VSQVIVAPSCSLLELDDGTLIPFISDAIEQVDTEAGEIRVSERFLG
jgi:ribosomal 30S subunit maturation factor RimM